MHHCLDIQEMFRAIVDACGPYDTSSKVALACTCRAFENPALDSLWHSQTSLVPLFRCLPRDVWAEKVIYMKSFTGDRPIEYKETLLTLRRIPATEDWARFSSYARRIRILDHAEGVDIDYKLFKAAVNHFQGSPPFLNLLSLSCYKMDEGRVTSLCLTPQLTHLTIYGLPSPVVLTSIKTICSSIRSLRIISNHRRIECCYRLVAPASELISGLSALEVLRCSIPLLPATIVHLSSLSALRELDIFDHPVVILRSLAGASTPAFADLTTLRINAWDGPSTAELLSVLSLGQLRRLEITLSHPSSFKRPAFEVYYPPRLDDFRLVLIFAAVRSCCPNLQVLVVDTNSLLPQPLLSPDIKPLFSLRSLTIFHIKTVHSNDFDDAVFKVMADAWPLLQEFRFVTKSKNLRPKVTINGLVHILSGCRQLKRLFTTIHIADSDIRLINARRGVFNGSTLWLGLEHSLVDDDVNPVELAKAVFSLCPNLVRLLVEPERAWEVVSEIVESRQTF